jgi:hypothetical protein
LTEPGTGDCEKDQEIRNLELKDFFCRGIEIASHLICLPFDIQVERVIRRRQFNGLRKKLGRKKIMHSL